MDAECEYCGHQLKLHPNIRGSGFYGACEHFYQDHTGGWTSCSCPAYEGLIPKP